MQSMRVQIVNRQTRVPVQASAFRRLAERLAARLERFPGQRWSSLTILVTDNEGIRIAKHRCFGIDVVTDVVAASYAPIPGEESSGWTGEVIVNAEMAGIVARSSGSWSPAKELALYLAHGIDHLLGGRDRTRAGRRAMRRRELRWLRDAAGLGLIDPILRRRRILTTPGCRRKAATHAY